MADRLITSARLRRVIAASIFAAWIAAILPISILLVHVGCLAPVFLLEFAFPWSLKRMDTGQAVTVPEWGPWLAWGLLAIAFGLIAWRRPMRRLVFSKPGTCSVV